MISKRAARRDGRRHAPYGFTEHGAYDVLKEATDLIPVGPFELTEEEKQSHHEGTKGTKESDQAVGY